MHFASDWGSQSAVAHVLLRAILASGLAILVLIAILVVRRAVRARQFHKRDAAILSLRSNWDKILNGKIPLPRWRFDRFTCQVLEEMILDSLEYARPSEVSRLVGCLRSAGLLDRRINEVRSTTGLRRRKALVALGRTMAPEAIPALAECLEVEDKETVIAAVRGLGRAALPEAGIAIVNLYCYGRLNVPWPVLRNALLSCFRHKPAALVPFLRYADGAKREALARVLAEVADDSLEADLLVLVDDTSDEIRAAAARALGNLSLPSVIPPLARLATDRQWFVRLRAVVALASQRHPAVIPLLVRALTDPNQLVRQRAAWGLMNFPDLMAAIVREAVQLDDEYGLQALVSELERSARYEAAEQAVRLETIDAKFLISALRSARQGLLLETSPAHAKAGD